MLAYYSSSGPVRVEVMFWSVTLYLKLKLMKWSLSVQRAMLGFTYSSHDKKCFMEHLRRFSMHVLPRLNLLFIPDPKNNMFFNYKHLQKCYDVMIQTSPFLPSLFIWWNKRLQRIYMNMKLFCFAILKGAIFLLLLAYIYRCSSLESDTSSAWM